MSDSILRAKSKEFAKDTVFLCRRLKQNGVENALINQLLRCGTSVGANIHEAQYAQGTKDFISKFEIALKECNESEYWLELLFETPQLDKALDHSLVVKLMAYSPIITIKPRKRSFNNEKKIDHIDSNRSLNLTFYSFMRFYKNSR